jgi:hypothetical protein
MSRKPANELRPNESRQAIWEEIRRLRNGFKLRDLDVRLHQKSISDYVTGLINAGFVEYAEEGGVVLRTTFRLKKDNGREAPRVRRDGSIVTMGLAREKMWTTMGIRAQKGHSFTARDLTVGSTREVQVSEVDAKSYCSALCKMGRLVEVVPGGPGKLTVYRMPRSKWTGPKPVQIQRTKRGYDPNTGETCHLSVTSVEGGE